MTLHIPLPADATHIAMKWFSQCHVHFPDTTKQITLHSAGFANLTNVRQNMDIGIQGVAELKLESQAD